MEGAVLVTGELGETIGIALAAMRKSPVFELKPIFRIGIYNAIRSIDDSPDRLGRVWLDVITVRQVLPVWQASPLSQRHVELGYNQLPERMLRLAEGLLTRRTPRAEPEDVANLAEEMTVLTGEGPSSRHYLAWCVFDAALSGLIEALGANSLADSQISEETPDSDLTSYGDAARWAAIAAAGGSWRLISYDSEYEEEAVEWDFTPHTVRERRRAFWEWWLQQAVPQALELAGQNAGKGQ